MSWRESIPGFPRRGGIKWRWLCALWAFVYRGWLDDRCWCKYGRPSCAWRVTAVLGWRSARVENCIGNVRSMTPIFWGLK